MNAADRRRTHLARLWRVLFAVYAVALTTGTHWPRLELAFGEVRAPDKILHMLGFGGLAFLLWRTGWFGSGWLLALVAMTWALLDEITQAIPILGRTFSLLDVTAGWLGILLVIAWIRAFRPVGGTLNRLRQAQSEFILDELFRLPRAWMLVALSSLGMMALIASLVGLIMWLVHPEAIFNAAVVGMIAGGAGGAHAALDGLWRRHRRRLMNEKRCFACGASCASTVFDEHGLGKCSSCGVAVHVGQWTLDASLNRPTIMKFSGQALLLAALLGLLAVGTYLLGLAMYLNSPRAAELIRPFTNIPIDLRLVIDMTIIGVIFAVAAHRFRRNVARLVDQQATRCRRCGHDVHVTGDDRGVGRCGECGTRFIRLRQPAGRALEPQIRSATRWYASGPRLRIR